MSPLTSTDILHSETITRFTFASPSLTYRATWASHNKQQRVERAPERHHTTVLPGALRWSNQSDQLAKPVFQEAPHGTSNLEPGYCRNLSEISREFPINPSSLGSKYYMYVHNIYLSNHPTAPYPSCEHIALVTHTHRVWLHPPHTHSLVNE